MKTDRRKILARLQNHLTDHDIVVAALAGTTADTYQVIDRPENLYLVGLGMVTQVALGLALTLPGSRIVALDTDGSLLLAPSILPVVAATAANNLRILVFDNEQLFGTRGGAASQTAMCTDLTAIARAAGIQRSETVADPEEVVAKIDWLFSQAGPAFLTAKIEIGERGAGPRMDGRENKYRLVRRVEAMHNLTILAPPKP